MRSSAGSLSGQLLTESAWLSEILKYLSLHFSGTLAVLSTLIAPGHDLTGPDSGPISYRQGRAR